MTKTGEREITKKRKCKWRSRLCTYGSSFKWRRTSRALPNLFTGNDSSGCELGYHEHHGETETYYVLSGSATYIDNDKEYEIKAGDVTFCKDGDGHGIKNHGTEPIIFIALVLKK
mgnify:CR=1 FL=1